MSLKPQTNPTTTNRPLRWPHPRTVLWRHLSLAPRDPPSRNSSLRLHPVTAVNPALTDAPFQSLLLFQHRGSWMQASRRRPRLPRVRPRVRDNWLLWEHSPLPHLRNRVLTPIRRQRFLRSRFWIDFLFSSHVLIVLFAIKRYPHIVYPVIIVPMCNTVWQVSTAAAPKTENAQQLPSSCPPQLISVHYHDFFRVSPVHIKPCSLLCM